MICKNVGRGLVTLNFKKVTNGALASLSVVRALAHGSHEGSLVQFQSRAST